MKNGQEKTGLVTAGNAMTIEKTSMTKPAPALNLAKLQFEFARDREKLMWFWLLVWGYNQVYGKDFFTGEKNESKRH